MRDIKFRCWWEGVKQMKYFVPGDFEDTPRGWCMTFKQKEGQDSIFLGKAQVMQFTGLHDKNGREIYEGDIIRFHLPCSADTDEHKEYIEEVVFNEGVFSTDGAVPLYAFIDDVEVIGNIYEPDLLTTSPTGE